MMMAKSFLQLHGIDPTVDVDMQNHEILMQGVAHIFWWIEGEAGKVLLNTYLSSHGNQIREQQLSDITRAFSKFKGRHADCQHFVMMAGGIEVLWSIHFNIRHLVVLPGTQALLC